MTLTKDQFIQFVYNCIRKNPSWFAETIIASQSALIQREQDQSEKRAKAEGALALAYPYLGKNRKIPDYVIKTVQEATLIATKGTEFGRKLEEEICD
jgi:hypothetical protein